MASVLTRYAWATSASVADPLTASIALASGTGRKLVVCSVIENASATVNTLTFDAESCTRFVDNDRFTGVAQSWFYFDIPDAKSAANYDLVFDFSAGSIRHSWTGWVTQGDTVGEPRKVTATSGTGVATVAASIATVSGDVLLTVVSNSGAGTTDDFPAPNPTSSEVTFLARSETTGAGTTVCRNDAVADATETVTVTWTQDGTTNQRQMYLINTTPLAAGPTITVQPVADTVILSNANTATFSVTATGTGSLSYDWELEDGVGSGVYANLANGNGATWTGQASASCSATLTAKTLTGRRVRCNVTDDNGTTTTNAVALTIWDGPQVTTFPATNGSGVSTATLTSDYVTGVGEAIEVRIPLADGDVAVTVTTT